MTSEAEKRETKKNNIAKSKNFKTLRLIVMIVTISSSEIRKNLNDDNIFEETSTYRST
jgi:hypothetical protein